MKYNRLGRTGVQVSKIALGTATFGVAPLEQDAGRIVSRALDLGINLFDTANSYGNQPRFDREGAPPAAQRKSGEEILGQALQGRRDEVVICTKVMEPVGAGVNDKGLSRYHIVRQVEQSLKRLKTDHIDVYYGHHPDANTPMDETLRAFDDLVTQGKVLYPALSTYGAWQTMEALWVADKYGLAPPVVNQLPYNLAFRNPEREIIAACEKFGLTLTVFSPLAGGLLAGPEVWERPVAGSQRWGGARFSDAQLAIGRQLADLAQREGKPPAAMALAWLIAKPVISAAIIGAETIAELETNVQAADIDLTPELYEELDSIGRINTSFWAGI